MVVLWACKKPTAQTGVIKQKPGDVQARSAIYDAVSWLANTVLSVCGARLPCRALALRLRVWSFILGSGSTDVGHMPPALLTFTSPPSTLLPLSC